MVCMQLKPGKNDADMKLKSSAFINALFKFMESIYVLIIADIAHAHAKPLLKVGFQKLNSLCLNPQI